MKYRETIGRILRKLRNKNGLSIVEVENVSKNKKIDRGFLSRIETGKASPSEEVVASLLDLYRTDTKYREAIQLLMKANQQKIKVKFIPKQSMERLAEKKLIEVFGPKINFPIQVEKIAENLDYKVVYQDLTEIFDEDFYGLLIPEDVKLLNLKKAIVINDEINPIGGGGGFSKYPETMQRMSIAHELSHIILKHKGQDDRFPLLTRKKQEYENYEYQANYLASALLMPENAVSFIIDKIKKDNPKAVKDKIIYFDEKAKKGSHSSVHQYLLQIFNVSQKALEVRLDILGYSPQFKTPPPSISIPL